LFRVAFVISPTRDGNYVPPLGILSLAALLREQGVEPRIFDCAAETSALDALVDFKPHLTGLTAVTSSVLSARRLAGVIKARFSHTKIIFGGPHATALPEEVIAWPEVDFVVAGEAERALVPLCAWLEAKAPVSQLATVPNLYHKESGAPQHTQKADWLSSHELDHLPLPAYDLLDIDSVTARLRHGLIRRGKRALPYMATRGCPHLCAFCCRVMGRRVRRKNPDVVLAEIESLVDAYGIDELYIEDDNFTASKDYALRILDGIYERKLPITIKFANGARIDTLDDVILERMRRAGCSSLSFGLESGSSRVLQMMDKHLDLDVVRTKVAMAQSHGFMTGGNMIVGYPGEREQDIWESVDFFQSLKLDSVAIVNLVPFPGTAVRALCEEKGYLTDEAAHWDNYYFDIADPKILVETEEMSKEQLKAIMRKVFFKLYTDPRRVWRLLRTMSPKDILSGVATMARRFVSR